MDVQKLTGLDRSLPMLRASEVRGVHVLLCLRNQEG